MDSAALNGELERLHALSHGWALSCCAYNPSEAADVLQTVYLKILEGRARFDGRSSFKTWLFAVIRTTAAEERRRHWLRLKHLDALVRERFGTAQEAEIGTDSELSDFSVGFQLALSRLPKRQREVLHLVFYQGLTIQEAASVMAVSLGSARTHYERGKRRLREWINKAKYVDEIRRN